jgi:hypothetical protein
MSSTTNYLRQCAILEKNGLISRGSSYEVGKTAKSIKLNMERGSIGKMITVKGCDDRPEDEPKKLIEATFSERGYFRTLRAKGVPRDTILKQIGDIYPEGQVPSVKTDNKTRVLEYLGKHPSARNKEVADKLGLGLRTIERYRKNRQNLKK